MQSQASKIVIAVIITAAVVGGGFYMWQKNQAVQPKQETAKQLESLGKYVNLVMDAKTASRYKTTQPQGLVRVANATPEGTDFFEVYVWATKNWNLGNWPDIQTIYLETVVSSPESSKETHTWYGPFTGKLKLLVE